MLLLAFMQGDALERLIQDVDDPDIALAIQRLAAKGKLATARDWFALASEAISAAPDIQPKIAIETYSKLQKMRSYGIKM
jgi:hypothetical protein